MADVYSFSVFQVAGFSGSSSYTVPAGYVLVVNGLDGYTDGVDVTSALFLEGIAGQAVWYGPASSAGENYASWRGRLVATAGQTVGIHTRGLDAWDVTVSGYLLSAP